MRDDPMSDKSRQPAGGKSQDACPRCDKKHKPGKCQKDTDERVVVQYCKHCGQRAKKDQKLCGPCAKKHEKKSRQNQKKEKSTKSTQVPTKKGKFGWSETSTIRVRGVAKNRWRTTYKGPRVRPENYLMEGKDPAKPEETSDPMDA